MTPNLKEWEETRLGRVAELQRGFDLPKAKRVDGDVPIVSSAGVSGYHNKVMVSAPGVVTGRYGSIGKVFYIESDFWPLNTALWVKNFHGNDPKFIYYLLSKFDFKKFSDKTGVPGINRNDIHAIKVRVPQLFEQKKIAKILSTWDKAIATTEQLLANSRQQKKALMQQLLTGKRRMPSFENVWLVYKVRDFGTVCAGGTPSTKKSNYWDGDIPWLTPSEVTKLQGRFVASTQKCISLEGVKNSSAQLIPAGSLLVCTRATIGQICISVDQITTNQGFKNIVPNEKFDIDFLYYLFEAGRKKMIQKACGSTFLELSKKDFENIVFTCPEYKEQVAISTLLASADSHSEILVKKISALKQERQCLMQQLLTGKKRVKVEEAA